jgi:hypothetical protein
LKTSEGESPPRVRISPPPPLFMRSLECYGCQLDPNQFSHLTLDSSLVSFAASHMQSNRT